jgi:Flp pilus assembly pilin Flp
MKSRRPATLLHDKSGVAAIEFAMVLPLMTLLFFGMLEASDLLTVKRRIANAGNSLADLVSQAPTIQAAEIGDSITGVKRLLEPTDTSTLSIRVVSVVKGPNPGDPVLVHWSHDEQGGAPYPAGSTYVGLDADTTVRAEASLVVVEMDYEYVSALGGRIFSSPFDFSQTAKRWPRKSTRVQLCQSSDPASCTS